MEQLIARLRKEADNVFGIIKGRGSGRSVLVSAHMDTVFDKDTDVVPRVDEKGVIHAPGIADDTRGMAEVLALSEVILKNGIRPVHDLIFCGDVGHAAALMGFLGAAGIGYDRWMKFMWKLFAVWMAVGAVIMVWAYMVHYS